MKIELYEAAASKELWLLVSSNQATDLPRVIEAMTEEDRQVFSAYRPQPVDYRPSRFYVSEPGFQRTEGWAFAKEED